MPGLSALSTEHHDVVITAVIAPHLGFPQLPKEHHPCCKRDWNSKTVGAFPAPAPPPSLGPVRPAGMVSRMLTDQEVRHTLSPSLSDSHCALKDSVNEI